MSDKIERIIDALRKKILEEAIRGNLVPQNPEDEPASVLLQRIEAERERLIKEKKIKRPKSVSKIFRRDGHFYESINDGKPTCIDDDIPFDIPDSWEWVRLGDILSVISDGTHKTPTYVENGIPFLSVQNISSGAFTLSPIKYISQDEHRRLCARVQPRVGDVLVCRIGTLGKAIVNTLDFEFSIFVSLGLLRPVDVALSEYITFVVNSSYGDNWIAENKVGGGTHTNKINLSTFPKLLIPLPSIKEQKRIAIAIAERYQLLESIHSSRLRYKRVLYKTPTSLRQQLIQSAIQGLLVPQNPSDEPASVLLERIAQERSAKLGKKAAKSMSRIERRGSKTHATYHEIFPDGSEQDISEEIPFDIPDSWEWVRMGNIGFWAAGATPNRNISEYYGGTIPWLKTGDLTDSYIYTIPECITNLALEKTSVKLNPAGSVLMAMYGATIGKLGILTFSATTNQACCACVTYEGVYNLYLFYYLFSQRQNFINRGEGGAQPNISKEKITQSLFPLPPIHEQKRICERLRYLLRLIEQ